jgi:hypothetical protein
MGFEDWAAAVVLVAVPVAILVFAGSSQLPDPVQKLLNSTPATKAPPVGALLASGRYGDYLLGIGVFAALLMGVYVACRFTRRRTGRP